jgi:phosphate transport system substrate-binding protein
MKHVIAFSALGLLALALLGCGGGRLGDDGGGGGSSVTRLNGAGATFIFPLMSKWVAEYEKAKGVQVNYQSIGSGGGIQQMTAQTVDFGCSDAPMNDEQLKKAKESAGEVVHIPLAMGAAVAAYNLDAVKEPLVFDGTVLADIFLGKITKWNDPALKKLNPDAPLPDMDIAVVHRSDGSGTTYIWVDYLCKVNDEWAKKVGRGTSVNWPVGVGMKGNEGVSGQVARTAGSIGYIELIYALQNKIAFGVVKNREGVPIKASLESVTAAAAASLDKIPDDLRYSLTNALGKDSYPISGTNWGLIYVNQPKDKGKAVVDFLRWCTHEGQEFCAGLHYAKLPKVLVERLEKKLESVKVGN